VSLSMTCMSYYLFCFYFILFLKKILSRAIYLLICNIHACIDTPYKYKVKKVSIENLCVNSPRWHRHPRDPKSMLVNQLTGNVRSTIYLEQCFYLAILACQLLIVHWHLNSESCSRGTLPHFIIKIGASIPSCHTVIVKTSKPNQPV
jgi:hypothetical protein